ncbi:MAG TPA: ankyrin repeat domain-containing protein [Steroidobacteraceae bacterium]|nr:ankyrin repeat domain-containing protein [Steroidobacteraceae bacterium]
MKCLMLAATVLGLWMGTASAAQTTLVAATEQQDSAQALALLAHGADVNATSLDGTTPLMWAAHSGDRALVEALLKAHAKVDVANAYGANAMLQAAQFGDPQIIEALLAAGANVESPNADGETALMLVARTGNVAAAKVLLKHGANVNAQENFRGQTALIWAAAENQPEMVKLLIGAHADVNARSLINTNRREVTGEPRAQARPPGGMTPLLYASRQGCLACVKYLDEGHVDLNLADPEGITPMLIATENFNFDIAAYLLKHGADVNRWDWWGRTPLYAAVDLNTLPYGGRADHISMDDTTSIKLIEMLLDAGANPNAQLKLFPPYRSLGADRGGDSLLTVGTTPLLRAARAGDAAAIKLLLAHHAVPDLGNNSDITPLMAAAGVGTTGVDTRGKYKTQAEATAAIKLLVQGGADVNAADVRGLTALHGAALLGYDDVIRTLAAQNARLDVKDKRGITPLDMAEGKGGGLGRGGAGATPHPSTADLLKQLLANNAQGGAAKSAAPPTAANTTLQ